MKSFAAVPQMDDEGRAFFVAKSAFDDGFLRESREQLKAVLEKYPRTPFRLEIYFLLGQIALFDRDHERAQMYFRRILRTPENAFQERAEFYLGQSYFTTQRDVQALQSMRTLLAKYPLTGYAGIAGLTAGKSLRRLGKWQEALASFSKVAADFPATPVGGWALVEQAKLWEDRGETAKAVEVLTVLSASTSNPLEPGKLALWLGHCLDAAGRHEESLTWYTKTQDKAVSEGIRAKGLLASARTLASLRKTTDASAAYADYLQKYPRARDTGWAATGLARLKIGAGDWEGAARVLRDTKVRHAAQGPRVQEEVLFLETRIAFARKDYVESLRLCRLFLQKYSQSPYEAIMQLGVAESLFYSGEYKKARTALEPCFLPFVPTHIRRKALLLDGDALSLLGHSDDAVAAYNRVLQEYPVHEKTDEVLHRLGYSYYQGKRWEEARQVLERLWEKYPESLWADSALHRLGWMAFNEGAYAKAADYFHALREKSPDGIYAEQALYQEGAARYRLHDYGRAAESYAKILEKFPQGSTVERALLEWGWALAGEGKEKEAAETFEKFLKQFPSSVFAPQALFWLGQAKLRLAEYAAANGFFEKLVQGYPRSDLADDALYGWAISLAQSGLHEDSESVLHRLLSEYPSSDLALEAQFTLAENEAAMKHYAVAIKSFTQIVAMHGEDERAKEAALRAADCYFALGDFAKALDGYTKLADSADSLVGAQARFKKAITWEALGEPVEAKNDLMAVFYTADAVRPWADKAALRLGEIFEREGRIKDACVLYEKLVRMRTWGEEKDIARERLDQIKRGRMEP